MERDVLIAASIGGPPANATFSSLALARVERVHLEGDIH
jgi:hypothetical protein